MKTIVLIFLVIFFASYCGLTQIISDFETGTDNWHSEGDGDYYWEATTGNPGGCFRVDDDATGDVNNAFAPVKFLGDWSSATSSDSLSVDIFLHQISGSNSTGTFVFQIKGPGGVARAFINVHPPVDIWTNYTAYLDPANWTIISGDWNLLLQQVTELVVRAEYINGDEYNRLDNVVLSITPVVIPVVPVICSDFEDSGYDGWSFSSTGGVSNYSTGGNPGRCIRITDGTGTSLAYPPPKYLGDWTQLDNHAADIRFDLKITNFTGPVVYSSFFLQISGPGGVAQFPMESSINLALNRYKTFVFPIDETYWTMISGTWNDLMDHVNSCEMVVEFINGTEIVWLDNFCITNLPPVAEFESDKPTEFPGNPIQFYDISMQGPTIWNWDFGDGQNSLEQHIEHTYLSSGVFDVNLTVSNFFGSDSELKTSFIEILPIDQCLKYEDDFNDNSISHLWWIKNGTWSEASGNFRQTSNHYVTGNLLEGCFAITGSPFWGEYILSCDLMSSDNDHIGFVFNWQNEQNMYMFYWNREGNYRRLVKWEDGISTILASDGIGYITNTWYHIEIYSFAGKLTLTNDGIEIFTVNDNTFTSGKAGLFCSGNQSSYWDNFTVECPGIPVELKVMLEGPYNGTYMNTDLNDQGLLPLSNPYTSAPWNHTGNEGVLAFTNPDVVDWVLVDFRDAPSANEAIPSTSIGTKAALLLKTGDIISPYGGRPLIVNSEINNNLFVVVFHRNHVNVISANPLTQSGGAYVYDFTLSASQAYGSEALKNLGGGVYGMYAGDYNADGMINQNDKEIEWEIDAGEHGFLQTDGNLDGQADNLDKNDAWLTNQGVNSYVPE